MESKEIKAHIEQLQYQASKINSGKYNISLKSKELRLKAINEKIKELKEKLGQ